VEVAGWRFDFDGVFNVASGQDWCIGAEVDGRVADAGEECGGELAGIDASLVEEDEAVIARCECGEETGEICWGEFAFGVWRVMWDGLQGGVGLEGDVDAGENADAVKKFWVEGDAEVGKRAELGWIVGIACGQHSGCGGGGFGEGG
jgi:hypothetical protein